MKPQDADKKKFEVVKQKPSAKLRMKNQVPLIHQAFERGFVAPFGPLIGKTMMSHDLVEYMKAISNARLTIPIYVEVSRQLSELAGYDPWSTAERCFKALDSARREAESS